jgi:hypothetical protein
VTALDGDSMSTARLRWPVVVGVDDRAISRVALDWGIDEASRKRLPLHIVQARPVPARPRPDPNEDTADRATAAALEQGYRAP